MNEGVLCSAMRPSISSTDSAAAGGGGGLLGEEEGVLLREQTRLNVSWHLARSGCTGECVSDWVVNE